nr:MAG TPA: hypothetical protein [Caudoviricetes sp.]
MHLYLKYGRLWSRKISFPTIHLERTQVTFGPWVFYFFRRNYYE